MLYKQKAIRPDAMQCNSQKAHCSWISYHCTGLQQSRIQCNCRVGSEHNACHFLQLKTRNHFFASKMPYLRFATRWRSFKKSCLGNSILFYIYPIATQCNTTVWLKHNSILLAAQPTAIPCKTFPLLLAEVLTNYQSHISKVLRWYP